MVSLHHNPTGQEAMKMKCGSCKQDGVTSDHVKNCYADKYRAEGRIPNLPVGTPDVSRGSSGTAPSARRPIVETDSEFPGPNPSTNRFVGGNKQMPSQASGSKYAGPKGAEAVSFPAGRYAVLINETIKFFKVDKPEDGRWKGFVFVKHQVSDDLFPVKGASRDVALDAIAEDPEEAMLRYGREIGHCGHCGRTLTNEESRRIGIGPICRGKVSF